MTDVGRIILDAVRDAHQIPPVDRGVYEFSEGDPSIYDLHECDFRGEDLPLLVAAAERADGQRREMLDQLIRAMRREGF